MDIEQRIDLFVEGVRHLNILTKAQEDEPNDDREKIILHELIYLIEEMEALDQLLEHE